MSDQSDNGDLDADLLALADDDVEEGEESGEEASAPGSPDSLGSGAMDESDDEAVEVHDGRSLYPLEGKYRDAADKARILKLSEIEREQILADRAAEIEKETQDMYLTHLFAQKNKKRDAEAAELEESQQRTSRPKVRTADPKLANYVQTRIDRQAQNKRHNDRKERKGLHSRTPSDSRPESDRDADGDSEEVEYAEPNKKIPKNDPLAEFKDVMHTLIKRENFAKVCFWPDFEKSLIGCFCRVSIGPGENGNNVYRIGEIKGFEVKQPYVVENDKGKKIMTDIYVTCKHGQDIKTVPFSHVSNSRATEPEFEKYKTMTVQVSGRLPTRGHVDSKLKDIAYLLNRSFTEAELNEKLKRQDKYAAKLLEITSASPPARKSHAQIQAERLDALNRENRKKNNEEIRNALLAERRQERIQRQQAAARHRQREADARALAEKEVAKAARLAAPIDDLFDGSDISRTATPDGNKLSRAGTPLQKKERNAIPTFKKKTMDDDVIAAMDFGLEVDI